jgi:uncharacterized protein YkwD
MMRRLAAVIAAVLAAGCGASAHAAARGSRPAATLDPLERAILADVNAFRRRHGLSALRVSPQLDAAASQHSREMADDGYFAHDSPGGGPFWKRLARFYPPSRRGAWAVGENLLWSSPDVTAAQALALWEKSPAHRANLLAARWREIGLSAIHAAAAPGAFQGHPVTIVTADFGAGGE